MYYKKIDDGLIKLENLPKEQLISILKGKMQKEQALLFTITHMIQNFVDDLSLLKELFDLPFNIKIEQDTYNLDSHDADTPLKQV